MKSLARTAELRHNIHKGMSLNHFSIDRLEDFRGEPWVSAYCQLVGGVAIKVSLVIAPGMIFQCKEILTCEIVALCRKPWSISASRGVLGQR